MHDWQALAAQIKDWGRELGFDAVGIADADLGAAEAGLAAWLAAGCHGEMDYMASHGMKRTRPAELVPGTRRIVTARMNYLPDAADTAASLQNGERATISRYALGRDYHKLLRARLQKLADRIAAAVGAFGYRAFDSAPVMEVELATRAGIGWRGKHTLLLARGAGSWFFLGEIFVDLPLPPDAPTTDHCGSCRALPSTPARPPPSSPPTGRCAPLRSYLTIELKGSIPEDLRPLLGNRIYGCDDCQRCCPWNREAPRTQEDDFAPRHGLDRADLADLFAWSEAEFAARLAGSPLRRIGFERWLRNIAVGLATPTGAAVIAAWFQDAILRRWCAVSLAPARHGVSDLKTIAS
jgi:epoxyqueuosine reductase